MSIFSYGLNTTSTSKQNKSNAYLQISETRHIKEKKNIAK